MCLGLSFALLAGVGRATGTLWITATLGGIGALIALKSALDYASDPTLKAEKRMDTIAGLWVFACYAIAGFTPVIMRVLE
jgi:hypothetical protein